MSADYSLVDNYLKRSNLFYTACNDIAEDIFNDFVEERPSEDVEYDMDRFDNDYEYHTEFMDAEYEDYINSYGMFKALAKWEEENDVMPSCAGALFHCIAWDKIVSRFDGLIKNEQVERTKKLLRKEKEVKA